MICWNCLKNPDLPEKKVSFRATCNHCDAELHCCRGCCFYRPGKPNDCSVPDTPHISDRKTSNFCEEFFPIETIKIEEKTSSEDVQKKLFGNSEKSSKTTFDSLFDD